MKSHVTHDSAAGTFTLTKGIWAGTFPISDIPKWLTFYRDQRERYPAHAANYDDDVRALQELAAQL
jgi:hypothetical protein